MEKYHPKMDVYFRVSDTPALRDVLDSAGLSYQKRDEWLYLKYNEASYVTMVEKEIPFERVTASLERSQ